MLITKNATTKSSEVLGSTFNFIDIWIKLLDENYDVRPKSYNTAMEETLKKTNNDNKTTDPNFFLQKLSL